MSRSPVEIRFSRINCVAVHLSPAEPAELLAQFIRRVGSGSGGVYSGEVAVLDGSQWNSLTAPPFAELTQAARQSGLLLAGVRHWPASFDAAIEAAGLCALEADAPMAEAAAEAVETARVRTAPVTAGPAQGTTPAVSDTADSRPAAGSGNNSDTDAPAASASQQGSAAPQADSMNGTGAPTLLIDHPVRSGQKIYAKGCDAVIIGSVNPGAEIIADGNIHVYGSLRGRALAGASGNAKARIIATSFAPELVAIAGYYLTFENGFPAECENQPVKIHLENQASHLKIEPLNIR